MNLKNVLILSDYDCTFTGKDGALVQRNLDAIEELKNEGGYFSFATGRLPAMMKKICPTYRNIVNCPILLANGAIVFDPNEEKELLITTVDNKLSNKIMKAVYDRFDIHHWVVYPLSDHGIYHEGKTLEDSIPNGDFIKFAFYMNSERDATECRDFIRAEFGDYINCFRSFEPYPEVVDKTVSKGSMINYLRHYFTSLGIDKLTVCCIGDYENDIPMLKAADISFCPNNAIPEVKSAADHIVCNHEHGAIADMINIIKNINI